MANRIVDQADYTFNAAARTITFGPTYTGLELQHIKLITNVADNTIIYQFNKAIKGGTLAGLVLTLTFDTTAMNNADILMIIVEANFLGGSISDTQEATQLLVKANTDNLNVLLSTRASEATLSAILAKIIAAPATAANQTTEITRLTSILAQLDVALSTRASEVTVSNIFSRLDVPLSTVATEASLTSLLGTVIGFLTTIDAGIPDALGQVDMSKSMPVVIASDQTPVPVDIASVTGDIATETTLSTILGQLDVALSTRASELTLSAIQSLLSSIDAGIPAALGQTTMANSMPVVIASNQSAIPVSGTVAVTGAGDATAANQTTEITRLTSILAQLDVALSTRLSESDFDTKTGSLTEAAPATDTASSGLNGRLQRIAQRLTTLLAVFPTTLAVNSGNKDNSTLRVVLATDQPQLTNKLLVTPDANSAVNVAQINGVTPLMGAGNTGTGSPRVTIATDQADVPVKLKPQTSGGLTTYHLASAGSTNATSVKGSAGQLYGWYIYNSNASARKVAFHNTSGTPTAGSSVFFSIVIPPTSGANVFSETGIAFSSGIGITTVTGLADSDSTGVAANDLIINLFYN